MEKRIMPSLPVDANAAESFIVQGLEMLCKALLYKETLPKDKRLIYISRLIRMKTYLDEEISKMKATLLKEDPEIDLSGL